MRSEHSFLANQSPQYIDIVLVKQTNKHSDTIIVYGLTRDIA